MSVKSELRELINRFTPYQNRLLFSIGEAMEKANSNDALPVPRGPGRRKASEENNDAETPKRGPGRPRKNAAAEKETPVKRGRGRPRKEDANEKPARASKEAKTTRAAPAKSNSSTDYSEMSGSELSAAADKMKLDIKSAKIKKAELATTLAAIDKMAHRQSPETMERLARKYNVELVFGPGRPPADDFGKARRIIVRMLNEGADLL